MSENPPDDERPDEPGGDGEVPAAAAAPPKKSRRQKKKSEVAHAAPESEGSAVDEAAAAALEVVEAEVSAQLDAEAQSAPGEPAEAVEAIGEQVPAESVEATPVAEDEDAAPAVGDGHEAPERLKSIVESLIFASDKPLSVRRLQELTGERSAELVQSCIEFLRADYGDRGVVLHEVAGGWQFRTNPLNAHWVQQLVAGRPVKLSRAQLETLAICAYRQPITRPEIDEIRGVDSGGTLKVLLDRGLVRILGKKEEPGRPMLYGTTKGFLEFFNLNDLKEMPTLREFYELSEDSMAKIKQLDDKRAEEGLPATGAPVAEHAPAPAEQVAEPAGTPSLEGESAPAPSPSEEATTDETPDKPAATTEPA